jgi:hypothetical protein
MKTCNRCKKSKSLDAFANRSAASDGKQRHCRSCHSEMMKAHYKAKPEVYAEKALAYRQTFMGWVRSYKARPCVDCGVQYHFAAMDFDHLGDKEFVLSSAWHKNRVEVEAEIAKCDVVCSNCHRIRTYNRRVNAT